MLRRRGDPGDDLVGSPCGSSRLRSRDDRIEVVDRLSDLPRDLAMHCCE
ncbi:hypothetical protein DB30_00446 [Enhygromyxa salina]|uniref:Uncharacterized protein n=1 Tax=Enhygromyxa salina TaxID=215803 RepID=A0A0C1ZQK6_9BACT|nr:hypothetical protein DB30_00446 [Enhygromyxa salina]